MGSQSLAILNTRLVTPVGLSAPAAGGLALMLEGGDPSHPLVMGRIYRPEGPPPRPRSVTAQCDGERLELRADQEIVLRCGRASITLTRAGKILLRGAYLLSRSSGVYRIKGVYATLGGQPPSVRSWPIPESGLMKNCCCCCC